MSRAERVRAGRRVIPISNPDRLLYPDDGVTKLEVATYYRDVAPAMVPYLRGRPAMLHRFRGGIDEGGFYHKDAPRHFPGWIRRARMRKRGGSVNHILIDDAPTLVYLVGQGMLVPHVWTSRADRPAQPDRVIWDLDPSGEDFDFEEVRRGGFELRELLEETGLVPFVQTTGSRGLHVVCPIRRGPDFDAVFEFAGEVAGALARRDPRMTTEFFKEGRRGRVFVDVLRNRWAQTSVPPYALRARPGAPVATPVTWEELEDPALGPRTFTIHDVRRRLDVSGDPWLGMARRARTLPARI